MFRFFFSAVFLNNKHIPNGNKTLEYLEKFCFSYCGNRPKSEILLWSVTLLLQHHEANQAEKVNGMY